jgi:spore maturation protein CgeB
VGVLRDLPEGERVRLGERARDRILASHTAEHRAIEFESIVVRMGAARTTEAVTA